jgi:hypothetical protein
MINDADLLKILSQSTDGLLFPSEIDSPFETTIWDKTQGTAVSAAAILKLNGDRPDDYIEETNLDSFFSIVTMDQEWHTQIDKERVSRFRGFAAVIMENLKEVKVFRLGKINIDVFIAGRSQSGNIVCISTKQLQT